ncbi:MAG: glycosyltransferase family 2 protein [Akkermansia sp.]|nr:glycosyltransferase family 2 protein [Akkermansia sp.]
MSLGTSARDTINSIKGLVSVIVPVYRVKEYVAECVQSLLNQTYPHIELIFIDDAGKDGSIELVELLLKGTDISYSIIRQPENKGVSVARNMGVQAAKGEFILFVDSDDFISEHCIEKLINKATADHADIVFGSFVYIKNGQVEPSHWCYSDSDVATDAPLISYVQQKTVIMPWSRLMRRDFYINSGVRFMEGIRYEDEPWSFSLILRAKRISFVKDVIYYYRIWDGAFMSGSHLDEFRINSMYQHLINCTQESYQFDIWKYDYFRTWYARIIFSFCSKVIHSNMPNSLKVHYLDKVYHELRLPQKELDCIFLYPVARRLSFLFPKYMWLTLLVKFKNFKEFLSKKHR